MAGVHRTSSLKFEHPGLGTTATRIGDRLVLQNDIGETDAHVIVISVENGEVSIAYSDVHANRLEFFEDLLRVAGFAWEETATRTASSALAREDYFLAVGRCRPPSPADLETTLTTVGSKVVFLIDWNRARKELRAFMRNPEAVSLLKWSATEEVGHRAFLLLGGGALILEAIDLAPKGQLHYRERLSEVLGTTRTRQYFQWVFRTAAHGLVFGQPRVSVRDGSRPTPALLSHASTRTCSGCASSRPPSWSSSLPPWRTPSPPSRKARAPTSRNAARRGPRAGRRTRTRSWSGCGQSPAVRQSRPLP